MKEFLLPFSINKLKKSILLFNLLRHKKEHSRHESARDFAKSNSIRKNPSTCKAAHSFRKLISINDILNLNKFINLEN